MNELLDAELTVKVNDDLFMLGQFIKIPSYICTPAQFSFKINRDRLCEYIIDVCTDRFGNIKDEYILEDCTLIEIMMHKPHYNTDLKYSIIVVNAFNDTIDTIEFNDISEL
jgi:hypothetical protein